MPFFDRPTALAAMKNLPATRGRMTAADDEFLNSLLVDSAGMMPPDNTVAFRVYFVAAKFLEQPGSIHVISSAANGVKFTGLAVPIASLYDLQRREDLAFGLIIPPGYEVPGEETATPAASRQALPFGSSSYRVRAMP